MEELRKQLRSVKVNSVLLYIVIWKACHLNLNLKLLNTKPDLSHKNIYQFFVKLLVPPAGGSTKNNIVLILVHLCCPRNLICDFTHSTLFNV